MTTYFFVQWRDISYFCNMKNPFRPIINLYRSWRAHRAMPLRLEFVVTDHCNLNCKGCTHYSPLAPDEPEDFDTLCRSIGTLSRVCGDKVKTLYLIGGETLLYHRLNDAMTALRQGFPDARLYIFTNGILLPRMGEDFWQRCRDEKFILAVTRYPIRFDYDKVLGLCREKGVETEVFGDRSMADSFFRFGLDPDKKQNPRIAHFKCYNRGCVSIVGDKIYPCSISACVTHLNRAHGTGFTHLNGDFLRVDEVNDVEQIKRLRDNPVPFCGYCVNPPATVAYGPSRREKSEWVD